MTFDEWWANNLERNLVEFSEFIARDAWGYQQTRINTLEAQIEVLADLLKERT